MSDNGPSLNVVPGGGPQSVAAWENRPPSVPAIPRPSFERPLSAMRRYKWLMLGVLLLAIPGGILATNLVKPQYEVRATIWIEPQSQGQSASGPIRPQELLASTAWVELLRSYRIVDAVVRKLALYVKPDKTADFPLFANFDIGDRFLPGNYELNTDPVKKRWTLSRPDGAFPDSGRMTDSVGRRAGLKWVAPASLFEGSAKKKLKFEVSTPRETAVDLMKRLNADLPERSNFLWLRLRGEDPQLTRQTLNAWLAQYVDVASQLKKRNVVDFSKTLSGQLQFAETSLHDAEKALEDFRIQTITLPAEGGPVAPGVESTRDPAMRSFFEQKIQFDDTRHDREALEKVISGAKAGTVPWESALLIPSVAQSQSAQQLRDAFTQLHVKQMELAAKREQFTDNHPAVKDLMATVQTIQTRTIPALASQFLVQLQDRENDYSTRIASASREMQAIPSRTIEEMRLRRTVTVTEGLYTALKARAAEAQLAEAGATPDVMVLDSAVAPLRPTRDTAGTLWGLAILAALGAAIGLAILLDAMDPKIRYPEQVGNDLGLSIAGAVPLFPKGGVNAQSPEQISQLVESIRSVRMHIQNAAGTPMSVAITSPSPGDGKSFVAANLAMSFSEAGFHTILVDADTRRGILHEMFELPIGPGLTDYLAGTADSSVVIRPTKHNRLALLPSGRRLNRSP
ncbi:MAG TPA: GNVR domain-containing protein, partial [Gemmatimonadaceae bacterium]